MLHTGELPIAPVVSANQNVTINIPRETLEEWPPCVPHKLKHRNREEDRWISNKPFEISNGARSLMTK